MASHRETHQAEPGAAIACTATPAGAAGQLREWSQLHLHARSRLPIPGGVRVTFPAAMADDVRDLARREAGCCSFLTISTTVDEDTVILEITAADPAAQPVVALIAGCSPS